jgi:MFS family permease
MMDEVVRPARVAPPAAVVVFARVPWGAIVAGALVALAAYLILAMLGLGLGLGAVDIGSQAEAGAITGAIGFWWSISALLAFFLGGWVAGRIAGGPFAPEGIFLGVLVWALVTVASFYLVTTAISTVLGGPLAVATDSVYAVLEETELQAEMAAQEAEFQDALPPEDQEDVEEARRTATRQLVALAEGAMDAGLWAAFTLLIAGGAAVAGVWFATEPPAWSRARITM